MPRSHTVILHIGAIRDENQMGEMYLNNTNTSTLPGKLLKTQLLTSIDEVRTVILIHRSLKSRSSSSYIIYFFKEFLTYPLLIYPWIHASNYTCMYSYLFTH